MNKRNNNKYVCFTKKYIKYIYDIFVRDDFSNIIANNNDIHFIDDSGDLVVDNTIYVENYIPSRDAVATLDGKAKIRKNSALREIAFMDANYTCELCSKRTTFLTNNGKMYFEAHHLIPCNIRIQTSFEKKLDHQVNLYCLCPECHRKIHLIRIEEMDPLLEKLYKSRMLVLKNIYNLDLVQLLDIYKGVDRSDEENM